MDSRHILGGAANLRVCGDGVRRGWWGPCMWRWGLEGDGGVCVEMGEEGTERSPGSSELLPGRRRRGLWLILDHFFLWGGPVQRDGLERPEGQRVHKDVSIHMVGRF